MAGSRRPLDAYPTPARLARRLVGLLPLTPGCLVLEPSAGDGAFVRALRATGTPMRIDAVEIRRQCGPALRRSGADTVWAADFERWDPGDPGSLGLQTHPRPAYDWVIGNPPYAPAEGHVRRAFAMVRPGGHVVFLLRLNFLGGAARGSGLFAESSPRHVFVLSERPGFTGGGTDMTEYGFFWWTRGWSGTTTMSHVARWKRPSRRPLRQVVAPPPVFEMQPDLPFLPALDPVIPIVESIEDRGDRFEEFHRLNPGVYRAVVQVARELRRRGWARASMKLIFERLRWMFAVQTRGSAYLLNNDFTAYYARLVMAAEPDLDGMFEVRAQRSASGWEPEPARLGVGPEVIDGGEEAAAP